MSPRFARNDSVAALPRGISLRLLRRGAAYIEERFLPTRSQPSAASHSAEERGRRNHGLVCVLPYGNKDEAFAYHRGRICHDLHLKRKHPMKRSIELLEQRI